MSTPRSSVKHSILRTHLFLILLGTAALVGQSRVQTGGSQASRSVKPAELEYPEEEVLQLAKVIDRRLTVGRSHSFRIAVTSGKYFKVVVQQQGIDVVASLRLSE